MLRVDHFLFLEPIVLVCLTFLLSIVARPNPSDEPLYTVTFMTLVLKAKFTKTRCILRACGILHGMMTLAPLSVYTGRVWPDYVVWGEKKSWGSGKQAYGRPQRLGLFPVLRSS